MPRQAARKQLLTFVKGLHTEASPLTFPENTAKDLNNVDLLRDGSIKRRRGLDFESSYSTSSSAITNVRTNALTTHEWRSVGGDGELNFLVLQVGVVLYFHQLGTSALSGGFIGTVDLSPVILDSTAGLEPISATSGRDRLFITSKKIEPSYIEYDADTQTFSVTQQALKIRDLDGVDDDLEIDERPTNLTDEHLYNLLNQGWKNPPHIHNTTNLYHPDAIAYTPDLRNRYFGNLITVTRNLTGRYPSNADVWYFGKVSSASRPAPIGAFGPEMLHKYSFGNTQAARGHFILPAFDRNRDAASGLSGLYNLEEDVDSTRPISIEFYAGRIWYLMADGRLLYSQVLESIEDVNKCYQEADPTAEDINELVATDGGEIEISGVGKAIKLVTAGSMLLLFASNGVWGISGAEQSTFSATSQYITKITYVGAIGPDSITPIEDTVIYWSSGGIYLLNSDQVSGALMPQNITETTIQTFYEGLGELSKIYARGKYDRREKKIYWLYNDDASYDGIDGRFFYNKVLIFDAVLQSFYKYSLPFVDGYPKISAMIETEAFGFDTAQEDVTAGGVDVTASSVVVTASVVSGISTAEVKLKLLSFQDPLEGDPTATEHTLTIRNVDTGGTSSETFVGVGKALNITNNQGGTPTTAYIVSNVKGAANNAMTPDRFVETVHGQIEFVSVSYTHNESISVFRWEVQIEADDALTKSFLQSIYLEDDADVFVELSLGGADFFQSESPAQLGGDRWRMTWQWETSISYAYGWDHTDHLTTKDLVIV